LTIREGESKLLKEGDSKKNFKGAEHGIKIEVKHQEGFCPGDRIVIMLHPRSKCFKGHTRSPRREEEE